MIIPLLKELDDFVDPEILKNYCPISNLTFLSKLIERCIASRLDKHVCDSNLDSKNKKGHSPETLSVTVVIIFYLPLIIYWQQLFCYWALVQHLIL